MKNNKIKLKLFKINILKILKECQKIVIIDQINLIKFMWKCYEYEKYCSELTLCPLGNNSFKIPSKTDNFPLALTMQS